MKPYSMTRRRTGRGALALLLAVALGLPASAAADQQLPSPKDPTIKVPVSIGGVNLSGSIKAAGKIWGTSKKDCAAAGCFYGNSFGKTGTAEISDDPSDNNSAVDYVEIRAAADRKGLHKPLFKPALGKFKTKEGIGLGSKLSALKKAYPKAKKSGEKPFTVFEIKGTGKSAMRFGFDRFDGRNLITSISLGSGT